MSSTYRRRRYAGRRWPHDGSSSPPSPRARSGEGHPALLRLLAHHRAHSAPEPRRRLRDQSGDGLHDPARGTVRRLCRARHRGAWGGAVRHRRRRASRHARPQPAGQRSRGRPDRDRRPRAHRARHGGVDRRRLRALRDPAGGVRRAGDDRVPGDDLRPARAGSASASSRIRPRSPRTRSPWPPTATPSIGRRRAWPGPRRSADAERSTPHAVRNATVGGIRDARTAGIRPANAPIRMAEAMPPDHASTGITTAQLFEPA